MRKTNTRTAKCHPDRPHRAKGLCNACYCKLKPRDPIVKKVSQQTWYATNKDQYNEKRRQNRPQFRDRIYFWGIKAKYNLDRVRYDELFNAGCWLCGEFFTVNEPRPHIDHDHNCCSGKTSCGKCVRGLAHRFCNHAIAPEDPALLRRIAVALEKYLCK